MSLAIERPTTTPEYGRAFGVVTPMANTTVEPEMQILLPGTVLAARAYSAEADSRRRLLDYMDGLDGSIRSFDVAPLAGVGFACTCFYLRGADAEKAALARLEDRYGVAVATSTTAIRAAFAALGVTRFALLAPYPAWLADEAVAYYRSVGLDVTARAGLPKDLVDTRGIYRLTTERVREVWSRLDRAGAQAVLLAGTGMPSLGLIATTDAGVPAISSNLALAAALVAAPGASDIRAYLAPSASWRERLRARGAS
jgi:maleate cis-trans isomerase